ncbi:3'-5' exonuclease [Hafnia paralvei]|uniref:3'-5' exonuclease n=1 Tax=Hafnia paralvei TaxID=546367 RepID=UPI003CFAA8F9
MINSIVIDIETMDVRHSALILSIGAFAFDIANIEKTRSSILEVSLDLDVAEYSPYTFYALVDTFNQLMSGRSVGKDTQFWWKSQGEDAHEALAGERHSLSTQLLNLSSWIAQHNDAQIYFRGTDFDGAILEHAYRQCGMNCPWKYNGKRDVRTYIDALTGSQKGYIVDHQPCFLMIKHHALHDAMNDAEQMTIAKNCFGTAVNVA